MADVALETPAEPRGTVRTDTLADSVVILVGMTVLQRLVGLVRSLLFCRWLPPGELGTWEMTLGFLVLAAPLIVLGLPGSFVRYTEYFRGRGQLKAFIRRATSLTAACAAAGVLLAALFSPSFARLVYGTAERSELMLMVVVTLAAVTALNVVTELLMSLRLYRFDSMLVFGQSLLFAVASAVLVLTWRRDATSVVLAYGGATALMLVLGVAWTRRAFRGMPEGEPLSHRALWPKLVPFAAWIWLGNWLSNMFETIDRYMIIHFGGLGADEALGQVGQYHSARVIPLAMVAFAALLGGIITPHLSHDWETGRRELVGKRINLAVKLLGLALSAGAAALLVVAPWVFEVGFGGKFSDGLNVFPLTLAYCTWLGMAYVAEKYLWCAEKAHLSSLAFGLGLVANVVLNLILLPWLGLVGAVLATTAANLLVLTLIYGLNALRGMRMHAGVWLVTALPLVFWFGPLVSGSAVLAVAALAVCGEWVFSADEKRELSEVVRGYWNRLEQIRTRAR